MRQLDPGMFGEFRENAVTDFRIAGELVDVRGYEHEFRLLGWDGGLRRSSGEHRAEADTGQGLSLVLNRNNIVR